MQESKVKYSQTIIENSNYENRIIKFETGSLAKKAAGSIVASLDQDLTLLSTTSLNAKLKDDFLNFFPLTVDVEERMYAVGKIPGSFFRREGRPSTEAILAGRLIDRSLRPLFKKGLRNEIQIISTILSINPDYCYDALAINASSLSVQLSGIPCSGPVAAVRLALLKNNQWIAFPRYSELNHAVFNMVIAGYYKKNTQNQELSIIMIEAEATENSWDLIKNNPNICPTEEVIMYGIKKSEKFLKNIIKAQIDLIKQVKINNLNLKIFQNYENTSLYEYIKKLIYDKLLQAFNNQNNQKRDELFEIIESNLFDKLKKENYDLFINNKNDILEIINLIKKTLLRQKIISTQKRIDGRSLRDIRNINAKISVLPRVHGSAVFERGETQILGITTLNMLRMEQQIDSLSSESSKRYMHNYNFPPYSTGEVGRVGSPKRREIGHGALAERAIIPILPKREEFPYAIRQVSEALGSNGSTSMASVCASTLSLLNAGVPIKTTVAGIAMGMISIYENKSNCYKYFTLTDILGLEDHFGDIDFKVAGTSKFITAIQLDTKIDFLPQNILLKALYQAKHARQIILNIIDSVINKPNKISKLAPKILKLKVPVDRIGSVIGPKGKVIKEIQETTGTDIFIEDDGIIYISSDKLNTVNDAKKMIQNIVQPKILQIGDSYFGKVVKIMNFGAFISLNANQNGLLHISELRKLGNGKRIDNIDNILKIGQKIYVSVIKIDDRGKISLTPSLK